MKPFRPMLAATLTQPERLRFPTLATPKLDGIRCVLRDGQPLSRSLKPIPNAHVRALLAQLPDGLDGELVAGDFQQTQSAVLSRDGEPAVTFYVFDIVDDAPYTARMDRLRALPLPAFCTKVLPAELGSLEALDVYEAGALAHGYEGVMLRSPTGPYKFGRSTEREGWLLKVKRFVDSEAEVIGVEEQMRNDNKATTNALGLTERSTHKANLVPNGRLGVLRVRDLVTKQEFGVSTGLTHAQLDELWAVRDTLPGRIVKYKYQAHGTVNAPRIPVFLGFRGPEDLDTGA